MLREIMSDPLVWLSPRACLGCGSRGEDAICPACINELEPLVGRGCRRCGNPAVHEDATGCAWCSRLRHAPPVIIGLYAYRGKGRDLFQKVKYGGFWRLVEPLIRASEVPAWLAAMLREGRCLVPIPASPGSRLRRLFNPAAEVAGELSRLSGLPMHRALRARPFRKRQVGLSLAQRRRNARNKFRLTRPPISPVVLVDDVLTSGATLDAATELLQRTGVPVTAWLTLFRRL